MYPPDPKNKILDQIKKGSVTRFVINLQNVIKNKLCWNIKKNVIWGDRRT